MLVAVVGNPGGIQPELLDVTGPASSQDNGLYIQGTFSRSIAGALVVNTTSNREKPTCAGSSPAYTGNTSENVDVPLVETGMNCPGHRRVFSREKTRRNVEQVDPRAQSR
jgi:hypothetical protein